MDTKNPQKNSEMYKKKLQKIMQKNKEKMKMKN